MPHRKHLKSKVYTILVPGMFAPPDHLTVMGRNVHQELLSLLTDVEVLPPIQLGIPYEATFQISLQEQAQLTKQKFLDLHLDLQEEDRILWLTHSAGGNRSLLTFPLLYSYFPNPEQVKLYCLNAPLNECAWIKSPEKPQPLQQSLETLNPIFEHFGKGLGDLSLVGTKLSHPGVQDLNRDSVREEIHSSLEAFPGQKTLIGSYCDIQNMTNFLDLETFIQPLGLPSFIAKKLSMNHIKVIEKKWGGFFKKAINYKKKIFPPTSISDSIQDLQTYMDQEIFQGEKNDYVLHLYSQVLSNLPANAPQEKRTVDHPRNPINIWESKDRSYPHQWVVKNLLHDHSVFGIPLCKRHNAAPFNFWLASQIVHDFVQKVYRSPMGKECL